MYYELHITCKGKPEEVKPLVEDKLGWRFSNIDGDPDLGEGVKCYATRQLNANKMMFNEVIAYLAAHADMLREEGVGVWREKIELVIYDNRH